MQKNITKNFKCLKGEIEIPADKSLSHRAVIFPSLAKGRSVIKNFSDGQDPHSTLKLFQNLGVEIEEVEQGTVIINSTGKLSKPAQDLDCGNSGTTMRLVSGFLAGQNFNSVLFGDESLSKRPMKRIIEPLTQMGGKISSQDGKAPLSIAGTKLYGIDYTSKIASAQVKSCLLLAGLFANGKTTITEPYLSRNHSEILLKYMGAKITTAPNSVTIEKSELKPIEMTICGDISSAAYFIVAGLIVPNSCLILKNIGLNPTRTGIIDVVRQMGGKITILDQKEVCGELVGDIKVEYSALKGCQISGDIIPRLIDEIPVIAVLATQANGTTVIKDASDLRNKESDRISTIVSQLKAIGADIEERPDGMIINGKTALTGGIEIDTHHDHRTAMSFYVAGLITEQPLLITDFEWVNTSFPEFLELMATISKD